MALDPSCERSPCGVGSLLFAYAVMHGRSSGGGSDLLGDESCTSPAAGVGFCVSPATNIGLWLDKRQRRLVGPLAVRALALARNDPDDIMVKPAAAESEAAGV